MKFGSREIANVVFKAKHAQKIGTLNLEAGQPALYIDTAKTSTLEGAATSVYATGGRGNTRLVTWEGEKTLTFTVEDAVLSPVSFSMLSGAQVFKGIESTVTHVHKAAAVYCDKDGELDVSTLLTTGETVCPATDSKIYILETEEDGSIKGAVTGDVTVETNVIKLAGLKKGTAYFVDFYAKHASAKVSELQIDAEHFGGYYYVEAETLFRTTQGQDLPAVITIPNVKIQSNFTFSMAATGDPSTFTFTMDAMPDYTYFDKTKKVLCVIQVVEDSDAASADITSVMEHKEGASSVAEQAAG